MQVLSYDIDGDSLKEIMQALDVSKAMATVASDKERILGEIEKSVG